MAIESSYADTGARGTGLDFPRRCFTSKRILLGLFVAFIVVNLCFLAASTENPYSVISAVYSNFSSPSVPASKFLYPACPHDPLNSSYYCHHGSLYFLNASSPTSAAIYNDLFTDLLPPPDSKKLFAPASNLLRLEIILIELRPTAVPRLVFNLYNIANIYGGRGVALTIVVSVEQKPMLETLLAAERWTNVQLLTGPTVHEVAAYSKLLTSKRFWKQFRAEHVLVTQTDVMIFREISAEFWDYDYIGAAWDHDPFIWFKYELGPFPDTLEPNGHRKGGNGGYSLRRLQKMIELGRNDDEYYPERLPEDVYWASKLQVLAPESIASQFAFELLRPDDPEVDVPTAMHKTFFMDMMGNFFRAFVAANPSRGS
ncbi:hypothetical protein HDV03_000488 [Kappamyces sp. JEL0829]|nr:hypothetical protein HDV03_000488 [Kappamyces sp. JEL0829]